MKFLYLLINFFTIIVPFLFSFHPRLQFYKTWRAFFPAVIMAGLVFIGWDALYTRLGVWGFNPHYITGLNIINLPIEEVLFFLCIPYACVFTFYCLDKLSFPQLSPRWENIITIFLLTGFGVIGLLNVQKLYTAATFLSFFVLLFLARYIFKTKWLGKFYLVYGVLLIPFFIVNGLLTGTGIDEPVVWYNNAENLDIRLLTIPVEDVFYGMELILLNLLIYYFLRNKLQRRHTEPAKAQVLATAKSY